MPLIAIEGADAVGKTTQVGLLEAYLAQRAESRGVALRVEHFPRLDAGLFSPLIDRFLTGAYGPGQMVDPQLVALLFACDRFDRRASLQQWLAEGDIVLFDRYVASNIAYQCAKLPAGLARAELRQWIETLEYDLFALPRAGLTLCFDAPLPFSLAQIAARRRGDASAEDVHEADAELQLGVRQMYDALAERDPAFCIVRCGAATGLGEAYAMRPIDAIFEEVKARVDSFRI